MIEFEWVVQPPATTSLVAPNLKLALSFTVHGPWIPRLWIPGQFQDEGLLFAVIAIPVEESQRSPFEPTVEPQEVKHLGWSQLPSPYDNIHANAFTFIPRTDIHAGQNLLSFSGFPFVSIPGTYRLQIWAFVVSQKVSKWLPGSTIISHPIRACTWLEEMEAIIANTEAMRILINM